LKTRETVFWLTLAWAATSRMVVISGLLLIAGPIVFLLSSDAALISGVCLPIDGGYTSR
jgi:NAD(P)-dependent dehydrogenase (short-subunit alcohol dehydrogenase family)